MRIGLISCSATKLPHAAPAQELYCGPIFNLSKAWITERWRVDEWGILSAKHGLVMPDQAIEPYDLKLDDLTKDQLKDWEDKVIDQLTQKWGDNVIYLILAGYNYRYAIKARMPYVEDVIGCWTQWRLDRGMTRRRAAIGIGVLKKCLKENWGYY